MTWTRMFALKNKKKLAAAAALFTVCGLIAGCDDGRRHHHPPHPQSHSRPPHDSRHGSPHRDAHHHGRRHKSSLVGLYSARALNDAVAPIGTTITLDVVETENESLRLVDPTGQQYPIQFDAETGAGYVAGGSLSLREDGLFVYTDAKGGVWLIEKK